MLEKLRGMSDNDALILGSLLNSMLVFFAWVDNQELIEAILEQTILDLEQMGPANLEGGSLSLGPLKIH